MKCPDYAIIYLLVCVFMLAACDSSTTTGAEDARNSAISGSKKSFDVKVVATICGTAILEIQNEAYYGYGIDWESSAGVKYQHVFGTTFPCFTEVSTGEIIKIQIVDKLDPSDCARCEAYLETPDKKYFVKVIK